MTHSLFSQMIETPLGEMIAIGDENHLHFLDFLDRSTTSKNIYKLEQRNQAKIISSASAPLISIQQELCQYFEGILQSFLTPLFFLGTAFQKLAWYALQDIPFGETRSYKEQATAIGKKSAYRAVANANAANPFAILVPCHRVITHLGTLGGYGGGIQQKQWLLNHEKTRAI